MEGRRIVVSAALGLSLSAINPAAHAATLFSGWFTSNIVGPVAGESARVVEGILLDTVPGTAGAPTFDYVFFVANTGVAPIAAFGGGTGLPGAVLYNSDISFGLPGLPASGPVAPAAGVFGTPGLLTAVPPAQAGKRLAGGWGGANNPFLPIVNVTPYTPLYPGNKGLFSPNYQYWGFEISSATGLPNYALGWYNLVGNQIFGSGRVTRFDLNSTLGPVAGGAFMDPPASYFIDWANGDTFTADTPDLSNLNNYCDTSTQGCSADVIPPDIASLGYAGYGDPTPLPGALPLFATGLGALGLLGWRKKRKVAAAA